MKKLEFKRLNVENKRNKIIVIAIVVLASLGVIYYMKNSYSATNDSLLDNQYVDGLSFENAKLVAKDGETTFNVEVHNETKEVYNLKNIYVMIEADGAEHKLVGYIGENIEKSEGKYLSTKIDADLSNATNIKYIINK